MTELFKNFTSRLQIVPKLCEFTRLNLRLQLCRARQKIGFLFKDVDFRRQFAIFASVSLAVQRVRLKSISQRVQRSVRSHEGDVGDTHVLDGIDHRNLFTLFAQFFRRLHSEPDAFARAKSLRKPPDVSH